MSRAGELAKYQAGVCDLDGVVYRGKAAIEHAVEALSRWGRPLVFATNNASRTPEQVAGHLRELGLTVSADEVVTSSQAAAWVLSRRLPAESSVLAIGGAGVAHALSAAGFRVVRALPDDGVAAVVQGYGADVTAADLAEAAYAVQRGAVWVATNTDATLPTDRGLAPGNGSLIGAVRVAVGRGPDVVAGKPEAPLYLLAAQRLGIDPSQVLAIGDRIDTDIAGAHAAGMDSLLVLTGVSSADEAAALPAADQPTHIASDLRALLNAS